MLHIYMKKRIIKSLLLNHIILDKKMNMNFYQPEKNNRDDR